MMAALAVRRQTQVGGPRRAAGHAKGPRACTVPAAQAASSSRELPADPPPRPGQPQTEPGQGHCLWVRVQREAASSSHRCGRVCTHRKAQNGASRKRGS